MNPSTRLIGPRHQGKRSGVSNLFPGPTSVRSATRTGACRPSATVSSRRGRVPSRRRWVTERPMETSGYWPRRAAAMDTPRMIGRLRLLAVAAMVFLVAVVALPARAATHTVAFDKYSLTVDGKRLVLWSGEFHYWRLPSPDLWRDVLQKMKAEGFNATSIYFDWGYHSPAPGVYDFSGIRDLDELLNIAAEVGIYVIARPGPYINAETDTGGFPAWLVTQAGQARTTAPDYLAAAKDWLHRVDAFIARHQYTTGTGTVLLYQVENELYDNTRADYMQALIDQVRADGITVPTTGNNNTSFVSGTGAPDLPGWDR